MQLTVKLFRVDMHIAMVLSSLARRGPVLVACDICEGLTEQGHQVTVYYLDDSVDIQFPCPVKRLTLRNFHELREFDVIHSHSLRPDCLAWFAKNVLRFRQPCISTIHNFVEEDLRHSHGVVIGFAFSFLWKRVWSGLTACAVLSKHARAHYNSLNHTAVVPNGRPPHFPRALALADAELVRVVRSQHSVIGAIAVVNKIKGLHQILDALPNLPNHAFLLIGDGPELAHLKRKASDLNVSDRFFALGFRSNARDYLDFMDVYVMPSLSEGLPLALLEAASAGAKIVCSDIPIFKELFNESEVAFFQLGNVEDLAAKITEMTQANDDYRLNVARRFSRHYSVEAMVAKYVKLYNTYATIRSDDPH